MLDSVAYIECIIDAYSKYFIKDIEQTENIKQCQSSNYHLFLSLEQVTVSLWSFLSSLIIFAERAAR